MAALDLPVPKSFKQFIAGFASIILVLFPILFYIWLVMGPYAGNFEFKNIRAAIFVVTAFSGSSVLYWRRPKAGWISAFAGALILYATIYKAATFLPEISTLPWSLGWSEGSRFFNASLFFSKRVYGILLPLPVLHPSRYFLQSLVFLIPDLPIWLHRFWQVILWLGMSLGAGFVLARRFGAGWGFGLFILLFFFQGPVYYHLLVMVILVVWGYNSKHFGHTILVVVLASLWAGISRINWFPVPGLIAATIYFIEVPVHKKPIWRYILPPLSWTLVGSIVAFLSQNAYILLSGNPPGFFGSSLSSDLLWYRLYPNATYSLGILRSIWRVSFPILLIILTRWLPNLRRYHWIRGLGFLGIIAVLFAGGILVSVKIGGGSNLHNMDAYLVILLIVGAGFYFNRVIPENPAPWRAQGMIWPLVFFALFIPIRDLSQVGGSLPKYNFRAVDAELAVLNDHVQKATQAGGEVLFINERQLLATHIIEDVPLVPEYEVVFMMEMAMGNNQPYLNQFYNDLKANRFDLIITSKPNPQFQDETWAFAEENNIWVERVTIPILCYYQSGVELPDSGLSLLVPREKHCD